MATTNYELAKLRESDAKLDKREKELEQNIRRLQKEKRRLNREKEANLRKHQDHIKILIGAHLLSHYSEDLKERLLNDAEDAEVTAWVDAILGGDHDEERRW